MIRLPMTGKNQNNLITRELSLVPKDGGNSMINTFFFQGTACVSTTAFVLTICTCNYHNVIYLLIYCGLLLSNHVLDYI